MAELGLTGAAIASFLVGRFFVREILFERWQVRLRMFSLRFARNGSTYLLMLRLAHAPLTLVNYGAGAIDIPIASFIWTTLIGVLPGTLVFTFAGARIPTLRIVAEQGLWSLVDMPLLAALLSTALVPWIARFIAWRMEKRMNSERVQSPTSETRR